MTLKSRATGSLCAGALGDAWGQPWEGAYRPFDFIVPAHLKLSDDTQLTLATCDSILRHGYLDPELLAGTFSQWYRSGRIEGAGSSVLKSMRDLAAGVHWAVAGATGEFAAGNGAAMRAAPLAFLLNPDIARDRVLIRDPCRITHHNDEAYAGALAIIAGIRAVLTGRWSPENSFLQVAAEVLPDCAVRDRIQILIELGLYSEQTADRFGASGHVVDSVPLALLCAQSITSRDLQETLAGTIRLGGDTDTIASMTGQLAGTVVGGMAMPDELIHLIDGSEELIRIASAFAEFIDRNDWAK